MERELEKLGQYSTRKNKNKIKLCLLFLVFYYFRENESRESLKMNFHNQMRETQANLFVDKLSNLLVHKVFLNSPRVYSPLKRDPDADLTTKRKTRHLN